MPENKTRPVKTPPLPHGGQQLCRLRKKRGETQQQVAKNIYLKVHIIKALENDTAHTVLPMAYAFAHAQSYARYLQADESLIKLLAQRYQASSKQASIKSRYNANNYSTDIGPVSLACLGLLVLGLAYGIWWFTENTVNIVSVVAQDKKEKYTPDVQGMAKDSAPADFPPNIKTEMAPQTKASTSPTTKLFLATNKYTWLRMEDKNGAVLYDGVAQKNTRLPLPRDSIITLWVRDAGAFNVYADKRNLGLLGAKGTVLHKRRLNLAMLVKSRGLFDTVSTGGTMVFLPKATTQ